MRRWYFCVLILDENEVRRPDTEFSTEGGGWEPFASVAYPAPWRVAILCRRRETWREWWGRVVRTPTVKRIEEQADKAVAKAAEKARGGAR